MTAGRNGKFALDVSSHIIVLAAFLEAFSKDWEEKSFENLTLLKSEEKNNLAHVLDRVQQRMEEVCPRKI